VLPQGRKPAPGRATGHGGDDRIVGWPVPAGDFISGQDEGGIAAMAWTGLAEKRLLPKLT
jgi:hypothetical protein